MQTRIDPDVFIHARTFSALLEDVKTVVFERDEAIDAMGYAIVAREHVFVLGLPGTAKSMTVDQIFGRIEGAKIASFQLTKGSTPASLVGAMSIKALKEEDVFRFNTTNMLPDADYAIIDEVFKGNAMTRNAALRILAEGEFDNGGQRVKARTKSVFATSNEVADALEDAAFYDRLLVRIYVDPVQNPDNRIRMVTSALTRRKGEQVYPKMFAAADLERLQEARAEITIPGHVHEAHLRLQRALEAEGFRIGDRRFNGTMGLAQARALVNGRSEMTIDDLDVFRLTTWSHPDDRRAVNQTVLKTINPGMAEVMEIIDAVDDGFEQMVEERKATSNPLSLEALSAATRFIQQAKPQEERISQLIDDLVRDNRDATVAKQALYKVRRRIEQAVDGQHGA